MGMVRITFTSTVGYVDIEGEDKRWMLRCMLAVKVCWAQLVVLVELVGLLPERVGIAKVGLLELEWGYG